MTSSIEQLETLKQTLTLEHAQDPLKFAWTYLNVGSFACDDTDDAAEQPDFEQIARQLIDDAVYCVHRPPEVMIDIETMSTDDNAQILSIGAVKFSRPPMRARNATSRFLLPNFYEECAVSSSFHHSPDTQTWWDKQAGTFAHTQLFSDETRARKLPLATVLAKLFDYCRNVSAVWTKGPLFDLVILNNAYRTLLPDKWPHLVWRTKFWRVFDLRTLIQINPNLVLDAQPKRYAHFALADAIHQAAQVVSICDSLRFMLDAQQLDNNDNDLL